MYGIAFEENVEDDLARIRPFDGRRILTAIEGQLRHEPAVETRQRKILKGVKPRFMAVPPVASQPLRSRYASLADWPPSCAPLTSQVDYFWR